MISRGSKVLLVFTSKATHHRPPSPPPKKKPISCWLAKALILPILLYVHFRPRQERLDWMYEGAALLNQTSTDEYLTGKAVKTIDQTTPQVINILFAKCKTTLVIYSILFSPPNELLWSSICCLSSLPLTHHTSGRVLSDQFIIQEDTKDAGLALFKQSVVNSEQEAWTRTREDPLLEIKRREKNSLDYIKNNPVKMAMIKEKVRLSYSLL